MGARRRCCCGCLTYSDDFNRADGPLGDAWDVTGTAAVESNTAKITSGAMIYQTQVVDPQGSFYVTFQTVSPQHGDIYDFIAYDEYGNPILTARFEVDAINGQWIISLRYEDGPWYADNVELIPGCGTYQEPFLTGREFFVSFDRKVFRVGGTTPEHPHYELWRCYEGAAGRIDKVGFSHGGGPRPIYIDDFFLIDHYVHNTLCPYAGCLCGRAGAFCWPDVLYLELTNPDNCYPQIPATQSIQLNLVYRSQTLWASGKVVPCYGCTTETWFYSQFFLICQWSPDQHGFRLYWCSGYHPPDLDIECNLCPTPGGPPVLTEWTFIYRDEDCSPFYMKFTSTGGDAACACAADDCDCEDPGCSPLVAEVTE